MPLVSFHELMAAAERGGYAVGYFECWNLESLQGVLDAAEAAHSPVIVGFSGVNLPDPRRSLPERLALYAALGRAACESTPVPACLLFNESPYLPWIEQAIALGFTMVMFAGEDIPPEELLVGVQETVRLAAGRAAVEAEMTALPGVVAGLDTAPDHVELTDPDEAAAFVASTGIDALAVSLGNVHLHGRQKVALDLHCLAAIRARVHVPLVLHGGSSIDDESLRHAIRGGIRKINVGSVLRRAFYGAVRAAISEAGEQVNPYEVLGSGLPEDILLRGRQAVRDVAAQKMAVFGSSGHARPAPVPA